MTSARCPGRGSSPEIEGIQSQPPKPGFKKVRLSPVQLFWLDPLEECESMAVELIQARCKRKRIEIMFAGRAMPSLVRGGDKPIAAFKF